MSAKPYPPNLKRNPLAGTIITVDGPTASGKGTLAKTLAQRWRLKFLDTGAIYRAVAHSLLSQGKSPEDTTAAIHAAKNLQFDFKHKGNNQFGVWVNSIEATAQIRSLEVGQAASIIATNPHVRPLLKDYQVTYAQHWQNLVGVVLDGRDTGARIAPQAQVKIFLTASLEERARRRWLEVQSKGSSTTLEHVQTEVAMRDARDAPNTIACPDAIILDATHLSQAETLQQAIEAVEKKLKRQVPPAPAGE